MGSFSMILLSFILSFLLIILHLCFFFFQFIPAFWVFGLNFGKIYYFFIERRNRTLFSGRGNRLRGLSRLDLPTVVLNIFILFFPCSVIFSLNGGYPFDSWISTMPVPLIGYISCVLQPACPQYTIGISIMSLLLYHRSGGMDFPPLPFSNWFPPA